MTARLIYADSERSADLLYGTGFLAPDPFLFIQEASGTRHLVISVLEVDRARRTAQVDRVHEWSEIQKRFKERHPDADSNEIEPLIRFFLEELGVAAVETPEEFPLGMGDRLRRLGVSLAAVEGAFWPQRAIKRPDEVAAVEEALRITGEGMAAGIALIRAATLAPDGALRLDGEPLTSERVRGEIDATLIRQGASPDHTIVSGGVQGADPHERGSGPLFAHQSIILDVFPRVQRTGYFGDMTRTVCRGEPPERTRRAWEAVRQAQERAFGMIRAGVSGKAVHDAVTETLDQAGFPTGTDPASGRQTGFFHGTGHGLGLEVHESPRISRRDQTLEAGHVVTVEPGVYYPDWGGVRLEDVVLVTETGCRNLTAVPKFLQV
ncbi:MAG: aminopeptidase P family protein [Magnetococcales bacterium]|nr:aminopeptidase P family protein [Magnetococcales bacterium]